METRTYDIRAASRTLRETSERLDYHVESGDYLALLATIVGFMEEALRKQGDPNTDEEERAIALRLAEDLRDDLRYVHANYRLVARDEEDRRRMSPASVLAGK